MKISACFQMPNIFLPFLSLSGGSGSHWNGTEYMVTQKLKWQKWWDLCGITRNHFTKTYCKYHDRSRQVNAQNVTVHIIIKKFQTEFIVKKFFIYSSCLYMFIDTTINFYLLAKGHWQFSFLLHTKRLTKVMLCLYLFYSPYL